MIMIMSRNSSNSVRRNNDRVNDWYGGSKWNAQDVSRLKPPLRTHLDSSEEALHAAGEAGSIVWNPAARRRTGVTAAVRLWNPSTGRERRSGTERVH